MDQRQIERPHSERLKLALFAGICLLLTVLVLAYVILSRRTGGYAPTSVVDSALVDEIRKHPHILFRDASLGPGHGQLSVASLAAPRDGRVATGLACERLYGTEQAALCLIASRGFLTRYHAELLDAGLTSVARLSLPGAPSRARVSPHARFATSTVFVSGDSYASGSFSTRTTIFDIAEKAMIADLEQFEISKDGAPFKNQDFNFWGVTFTNDDDRFFATLGTGGKIYLVEARISTRSGRTLREGVECPSISPDGTRLAFKARRFEQGRLVWRLSVLDLRTMKEAPLSETRSVDDQAEWLDDGHVLYAMPRDVGSADVWVVRADGTGAPQLFLPDATSPVVIP